MTQGFLTTHILDTSSGTPAAGVRISLFKKQDDQLIHKADAVTNADGRTDTPILPQSEFTAGEYQLVFYAGEYFDKMGLNLPEPKFLNEVVLSFGMADEMSHYHVPLLLSPFGYSTYRGS